MSIAIPVWEDVLTATNTTKKSTVFIIELLAPDKFLSSIFSPLRSKRVKANAALNGDE